MSRGGIGSASVVLVFAVLALVIFSVISLVPALNEDALMENELNLVAAFYRADTLAERVFAGILAAPAPPQEILGVEIESYFDFELHADYVRFMCEISDTHGLFVSALIFENHYEILEWRMVHLATWQPDDRINVWQGDLEALQ